MTKSIALTVLKVSAMGILLYSTAAALKAAVVEHISTQILERAERLIRPRGSLQLRGFSLRSGIGDFNEARPPFIERAWRADIYRMKVLRTANEAAKKRKPRH